MKRKPGPEHSGSVPKRFSRQDPVSCESCRKKKVKCDRQRPCSSCVIRRLNCNFAVSTHDEFLRTNPHPERALQSSFRVSQVTQHSYSHDTNTQSAVPDPAIQSRESLATAEWLEHIHMGDRVPAALSPQLRAELGERDRPTAGPSSILFSLPPSSWIPNANPATVDLIQYLPKKEDTIELLRYYCSFIDYLYHIIIPSTVERQIEEVYQCVEGGRPAKPALLALVFAITGSSLFVQFAIESSAHASRCSQQFIFLTGAALVQANHIDYPTIEGLQAAVIVQHNISTVHCSATVRGLFSLASIITQAKDMLLHRIDTPQARNAREVEGFDPLEVEMKRRLWWDIVSLDWYLGFLSGPQEWTYLISTKFMCTDMPLDLPDHAIGNPDAQPGHAPSDMTYFIERLRLAEVCRSIVDTIGPEQVSGKDIEYAKILDLDRQLREAQSGIADIFRLDSTSRRRFSSLYLEKPTLAWQRCILQQAYYSRLCRLHRPFFIRGARDAKYSYSHVVGMASARKVLEINRIMDEEEPKFPPSTAVVWAIMHHVFMAAVMMLLDVCYNPDDILGERRKEEVLDTCRRLSKAQQSSSLVKEGIDAMMGVLRKQYKGPKPITETSALAMGSEILGTQTQSAYIMPQVAQQLVQPSDAVPFTPLGNPVDQDGRDLEDIWSDLIDHGANFEFSGEDWTGLFSDLTTVAMPR
ncbi:hypothetical protein BJX63DRAFT_411083 [Aspergillus granulosus]|uniref:Zn(2)-C6 fungal-type domain-containing protein n=1 Tax=Aspergillus granulosus TaxID=176169 RepID=A0ABR4GXD6_9EURO